MKFPRHSEPKSGMSAVVTGAGVVSPLGHSVAELTRRFALGESAILPVTGTGREGALAAVVADIPQDAIPAGTLRRVGRMDRITRLFLAAASRAVVDSGLDLQAENSERVGLVFGTGLGCLLTNAAYFEKVIESGPAGASPQLFAYTVSSAAAGEVSIALGIRGVNATMHAGLAAGLQAIGRAVDLIHLGRADVVLAGGGDALGPTLLQALDDMGLLKRSVPVPFEDAAPGLVPGEGAVVVVLESPQHAAARQARPLARVAGYASGFEPTLAERQRQTTGIDAVLRRALAAAARPAGDVGIVMSSAHGTPLDAVEAAALRRLYAAAPAAPLVFAPKRALGDGFAASGALAFVLAAGLMTNPPRPRSIDALAVEIAADSGVRPATRVADRLARARSAMIHGLCYSGTSVAVVLDSAG